MPVARDAGGFAGTIVVDVPQVRRASSVLADAAHAYSLLGSRVRGRPLPEMPPGVAERVQIDVSEVCCELGSEPPKLIDAAQELRVRAFWAEIADRLSAGYDLEGAALTEFKAAYASGLLLRYAEPWEADLARAYAKLLHDREHPGGLKGFLKGAGDFFTGAWDAIKDPAVMLYHLTPLSGGWTGHWSDLGHGLAFGVTHPVEMGKALVNLDALHERGFAYWIGNLAPAAAATVLSGGAAAGLRGAEGTAALDRAATGAVALERDTAAAAELAELAEAGAVKLTAPGDRFGEFASRATPLDGHTDVIIHGAPHGFAETPTGRLLEPREVARRTLESPDYCGGPVRLVSCSTGAPGATAARDLAAELGVDVVAPDDLVWAFPSGKLTIGANPTADTGNWVRFAPGRPAP
jgi:hypothetical protein